MYQYSAKILKWIDGDTVRLTVDVGFHLSFTENFRLAGINTPEIKGGEREEGLKVLEFVKGIAPVGMEFKITTEKNPGKYGRWIVDIEHGGESISKILLDNKFAKKYEI